MKAKAAILVVDDREEDLAALDAVLSDLGHPVIKASSGEQALGCLLNRPFAVVLLDVRMPGMDGFETASLIRKRKASEDTPIIFLTAADQKPADVDRAYVLGAVDYLSKPVNPETLRTKVRVFVDLFLRTRRLDDKAEELEAFSSTVAHDLRAFGLPVTSLITTPIGTRNRANAGERIRRPEAKSSVASFGPDRVQA